MNDRFMKIHIVSIALLSCITGCSQIKSEPINEFSQNELKNGLLIDVRTAGEYAEGHLDKAVNVDWFRKDFIQAFDTVARQKPLFLYCKKGGRSAQAARVLDSLGYQVINLEGGYDAYLPK